MNNLKKLFFLVLVVLLMVIGPLTAQTAGQAAGENADKLFKAGKDAIHKKDWNAAVRAMEEFQYTFPSEPVGSRTLLLAGLQPEPGGQGERQF